MEKTEANVDNVARSATARAMTSLNDKMMEDVFVLGANANMKMERWGNICLVVRELLNGATVDECMAELDRLQEEPLQK